MEDRDRPPLGAEFYERIEAALYSVQTRYGAKLKLFAEDLPGASPIDRVLGGYEDVLPPKQPIALCKHLREYAIELFETEARIYPRGDSLSTWLESLARRVEQRIIGHVLSIRTSGMSALSVGLTYHASEPQMREAIRAALQTRASDKLPALSKSEESPASAASEFAPVRGGKHEQNRSSDGAASAGRMPPQNVGGSAQDAQVPTDRQQGKKTEGIDKALREIADAVPAPEPLKTGRRRGRLPNQPRRDAIRNTISERGEPWRDHLSEIFTDLDSQAVALGDFQDIKTDLGDGKSSSVSTWSDLDLAQGDQRRQIIDTLRKYLN